MLVCDGVGDDGLVRLGGDRAGADCRGGVGFGVESAMEEHERERESQD